MNDHLPECCMNMTDAPPDGHCICDRLRACEQRAYNEKHHDPGTRCDGCHSFGYDEGYAAGVQAARDAVAALPHEDGCCSKGCACQTREKPEPCDLSCNCSFWWMGHALAAIDALRGE